MNHQSGVSIPFIAGQWSLQFDAEALLKRLRHVSIPFIAGQWSLHRDRAQARARQEAGFNPLHCGAVVASEAWAQKAEADRDVSIPFIAGQWSLLRLVWGYPFELNLFQSPSLRGSGRFGMAQPGRVLSRLRFNPLHCGAVVASGPRPIQIGSGGEGFNPLHCGAVVASPPSCGGGAARRGVSIPFIAGQWSLLGGAAAGTLAVAMFQSPSLRGSGRFTATTSPWRCCLSRFQSPSLRGSGRFIAPKTAFQR